MAKLILLITAFASGFQPVINHGVTTTQSAIHRPGEMPTVVLAGYKIKDTKTMWITAYSSTEEETDETPFITASGKKVKDGIIATNELPFGTKIMIPAIFGNKIFIVEDRMHRRKAGYVDIWMPSKEEALKFGIHNSDLVVLEEIENPKDLARGI